MKGEDDITGQRFGKLVVIEKTREKDGIGCYLWLCKCDCGGTCKVRRSTLRTRGKSSCGCNSGFQKTHGKRHTRAYGVWAGMKGRCLNKSDQDYEFYGGRGITVCDRWLNSFENFYADMGDPPDGMTLERIKNNRGYEPGNCRWATRQEQNSNRRSNHRLRLTMTIQQWADLLKIGRFVIASRLKRGWTTKRALITPVRPMKKPIRKPR